MLIQIKEAALISDQKGCDYDWIIVVTISLCSILSSSSIHTIIIFNRGPLVVHSFGPIPIDMISTKKQHIKLYQVSSMLIDV